MTNYGKLAQDFNEGLINANVRPVKGSRNDAAGVAFELAIKKALNAKETFSRGLEIDVELIDTYLEIKQGSAILWKMDFEGVPLKGSPLMHSDYVIYSFGYDGTEESLLNSWVIPVNDFIAELEKSGMIRYKKSSAMLKKPKEKQYYDCLTIKDLNRCKAGKRRLAEAFKKYGTFSEYYELWRQE